MPEYSMVPLTGSSVGLPSKWRSEYNYQKADASLNGMIPVEFIRILRKMKNVIKDTFTLKKVKKINFHYKN